ncbi:hypothetical protein TCAL_11237 [Tigriopus californicus]|uniref:PITH domain-containing protein n=1 Tax=Tigriopus californicus TaxID=6832 RepID=A0A553N8M2_TIGCA|nr:PITH domain-containing protein GA19395-like [Tigriopus californicus]TRY61791.1 hypothetical protein TCAL_11237 [Tigriopus californicus]|eukprot:TCALIF_11237-PA protein Name:"Similar to GA19395 PITH domain-containing protein GA19395 (Drosophila pseudoobscura pseudoobscura)" AED:0.01 eAED:0.01 QI:261/1/1/1/0.5/1/3/343/217
MSHNHGGCCGHGNHGGPDVGVSIEDADGLGCQYSLYQKINLAEVACLNETVDGSGQLVFKPWDRRLDKTDCVVSDADEELLWNIPFSGNVKLKGVIVVGGEGQSHPQKMRLFKNREHMTFDEARAQADQEFDVVKDPQGQVEYPTKVVSFSNVHHLTIHFPSNYGDDETKVYYIGLKGEFFKSNRVGVVNTVYEARPMMEDHKQDLKDLNISHNAQF